MTQPWYPFFWSDYSGKTFDLTQGQHGAYLLFMRYIYTTAKRIPDKQRYSIARATTEQEQQNADSVLNEYFTRDGDNWYQSTCDQIMAEAESKHEKRVNAGKKGGEAKSSNAKDMLGLCSSNHNHNQNQKDKPPTPLKGDEVSTSLDSDFDVIFHMTDTGRDKTRLNAPGWDVYHLAGIYNQKVRTGQWKKPKSADAAFPAWAAKYTKGKRP